MGMNFARKGYEYLNAGDYLYYTRLGFKNANQAVAGYSDGWNPDTQNGCGTLKITMMYVIWKAMRIW